MKTEAQFDPNEKTEKDTIDYETPKIIFEGDVTTRAGTPPPGPNFSDPNSDGVDLFDN